MIPKEKLMALPIETLMELNSAVVEVIKFKRKMAGREVKYKLIPGKTQVTFNNRGVKVAGVVKEVNSTRAVVAENRNGQTFNWTVPMGALTVIPPTDKPMAVGGDIPLF